MILFRITFNMATDCRILQTEAHRGIKMKDYKHLRGSEYSFRNRQ